MCSKKNICLSINNPIYKNNVSFIKRIFRNMDLNANSIKYLPPNNYLPIKKKQKIYCLNS